MNTQLVIWLIVYTSLLMEVWLQPQTWGRYVGLTLRLLVVLPLTFGPILVISNFLYVALPTLSLILVGIVMMAMVSVIGLELKREQRALPWISLVRWGLYIVVFSLSLVLAQGEPAMVTPGLFEHGLTLSQWITTLMIYGLWLLRAHQSKLQPAYILGFFGLAAYLVYLSL